MILETVCVGAMEVNCYILALDSGSAAIIIDPGAEAHKIRRVLEKHKLTPAFIVNTHGHFDHIGADNAFGVPVYVHKLDAAMLKDASLNLSAVFALAYQVESPINILEDGQVITLGSIELEVAHLPGHTPGGIGLILRKPQGGVVFSGDALFHHSVGRSDLAGGDAEALIRGIKEKLFILPDDTKVYPGHGSFSTIGEEKQNNPYLQ